jgi:ABC-2 type transport system ATP-binding protein
MTTSPATSDALSATTNGGPPVVEAIGLKKVFKDFWGRPKANAVDGIDFEIHQGEVLGFLGPNGSGKSTTVKLLLDLLTPSSGSLRVFGKTPNDVGIKRRIGYLPEETYLYRYLTAAETLDFFGSLFDLPRKERQKRTEQLLDMVGLTHAADRPVGEFSKGMARRIGIAQALINDPDLIILDEPTSGLDPLGCRDVKDLISTLKQRKKTVILCSHLLSDVEDVSDNVLIMYGGRVRARGSLDELLTVDEQTRITVPALQPDVLDRVMAILNETAGEGAAVIDRPARSLEDFFMEVVNMARAERVATDGVGTSGDIATYLTGEKKGEELLASLAAGPAEEKQTPPPPEPAAPAPDVSRLAELTRPELPSEQKDAEPADAAAAEKQSADELREQSSRLEDLMKKRQGGADDGDG